MPFLTESKLLADTCNSTLNHLCSHKPNPPSFTIGHSRSAGGTQYTADSQKDSIVNTDSAKLLNIANSSRVPLPHPSLLHILPHPTPNAPPSHCIMCLQNPVLQHAALTACVSATHLQMQGVI